MDRFMVNALNFLVRLLLRIRVPNEVTKKKVATNSVCFNVWGI